MATKLISVLLVAMMLSTTFARGLAHAACSDRPGTPNNVRAVPLTQTEIQVRWRNTASERVWWDVEMRGSENGPVIPLPAGVGRGEQGFGLESSNVYSVPGAGTRRCFRVKARTGPHTEGCLSAQWSGQACATSTPISVPPKQPGVLKRGPSPADAFRSK
jgi:hypothetical protein